VEIFLSKYNGDLLEGLMRVTVNNADNIIGKNLVKHYNKGHMSV
jgi:hypothetical protein